MSLGSYELKTIDKVLTTVDKLRVPFFQRPYSWKKAEQIQFFDDLIRIHDEKIENYFIGSLFFQGEDSDSIIIDGQQRLTTITIFIAVIRDILKENNDERYSDIENKYLGEKDLITQEPFDKLRLNDINYDFFKKIILKRDKPEKKVQLYKGLKNINESNILIFECYNSFNKLLKKRIKSKEHPKNINELLFLLKTLLNKFQALTVSVTDENEAFTIFETLNDRGLDLTIADLLKNYLFSIIYKGNDEDFLKALVRKWDSMVENLGKDITGFFKHYWNSKNDPISEKQIFKALKNKIKTRKQVKEFLNEIYKEAEVYYFLLNPEHSYWKNNEIENLLEEISTLGIRQCLPVLLVSTLKFKETDFIKTLNSCIGLSFRYSTVCNLHNNKLERVYSKVSKAIRTGEIKSNSKVRGELKNLNPNNSVYDESFKNLSFKNNKTPRYILKKMSDSLDTGKEIIAADKVTLEHIIPIQIEETHKEELKKIKINHREVIYKLYNMTILGEEYNSKSSSKKFAEKLVMYKKSKLPINKEIISYSKWTRHEIVKWTEYLLQLSKINWKL